MSEFEEKLQSFLDNKCVGDWGNCVECPSSYHIDGACTHPEHPSMQPVKTEFKQESKSSISKVFHDIRNTYQSLLYHFDDVNAEGFKVDPKEAIERMNKDLALMLEVEKSIREVSHG